MLLTDNLEVFIVKANGANDFRAEYLSTKKTTRPQQPYIAVKDGETYSIAVVFGKDFEITPPTANPALDHRVSACRIKIEIDNGLAVAQRIFRMPDTEKRPKVQEFSLFETATFGGIAPCELQFVKIPMHLRGGFEMTRKLWLDIGRIDIWFERGYIDFSDSNVPRPPKGDAGCCDPTLISRDKKNERFRTKFIPSKNQNLAGPERGKFISREDATRMKIIYCSEEHLRHNCESGELIRATHTAAQMAAITALDRYLQLREQRRRTSAAPYQQLLNSTKRSAMEVLSTPVKTTMEQVQSTPELISKGRRSSGIKPSKTLRNVPKSKRTSKDDESPTTTKLRKKVEIPKPVPTAELKEPSKPRQGGGLLQASQVSPSGDVDAAPYTPRTSPASKKQRVAELPASKHTAEVKLEKTEHFQQNSKTPNLGKRKHVEVDLTLVSDDEASDGGQSDNEEAAQPPRTKKAKKAHLGYGTRNGAVVSLTYEKLTELQGLVQNKTAAEIETPRGVRAQTEVPTASVKPLETVKPARIQNTTGPQTQPEVQTSTEPKTPNDIDEIVSPRSKIFSSTTSSRSKPFDWREQAAELKRCLSMPPEPVPKPVTQDTKAEEKAKRKRTEEEKSARKKAKEDAKVETATKVFDAVDKVASPKDPQECWKEDVTVASVTPAASVVSVINDNPMIDRDIEAAASTPTTAVSTHMMLADLGHRPTTPSLDVSDGGSAYIRQLNVPSLGRNHAPPSAVAGWKNLKDLVDEIESQQPLPTTASLVPTTNLVASSPTNRSIHSENSQILPAISVHKLSDTDIKVRIAKHEYKILAAESAGQAESEEVIKKKIEMVKCKIELGIREIERLEEKLAG